MGIRLNVTLIGARPMCRCLECSTINRKTSMIAMWPSRANVSIHSLACTPSGRMMVPISWEKNAPLP